jgi:STAM-binding protein
MILSDEMTLSFACFCSLMPTILNQDGLQGASTASQDKSDDMLSVLSLDDGRWSLPVEQASLSPGLVAEFSQLNIRQPSPPPVLAQLHPEHGPIPPSRVADPRPGLATSETGRYQNLHVVSSKCSFPFLLPQVHYI